ncbi:Eukaryotic aspartyl protease family protein [Hibiscus syriacus]|uniref:Eukaryotic aspartyl protease family protein n=1 Tax=Hibiscus syriacus TaxID=106335 RepID=A0A6A3CWW9_HIBSY|nr:protein ENHANCED DISEASE RESISTANCE 2-like [Hibiscus syriacus]KAE8731649.1 Eukaryotic aspartyl protease family protein [Hibiscus syriacus]
MCPTNQDHEGSAEESDFEYTRSRSTDDTTSIPDWMTESIDGGALPQVDVDNGTNGWASPPGDLFLLRSKTYLTNRQKCPAGDYLLSPIGMDWLKSASKLENVLSRPDNRVSQALKKAQSDGESMKSFVFAVNIQVPSKDNYSAVFYFATEDPIPSDSLLYQFVHGDDAFRNQRFKMVNRIVEGPWVVKRTVGNYAACLIGKALTCNYHRGANYLEIDVDIASSAIANTILHLALGYATSVIIDMGFVVEGQTEDELPENLIGAVRVCRMEMSSATVVDSGTSPVETAPAPVQ